MDSPLFFGPKDRPLFGWLHATPSAARVGLVLCNPFGYEAICSHRTYRCIATAAAAAGIPALRFDHDGTGDSAGDDRDPERLAAWVAGVRAAIETLRQHCGVERVVLLGVRLGALIATLAADGRDDVCGLIAIAPVVAGRAYVRELKILQGALGLPAAPAGSDVDPELQEAVGFTLTAETRAAIGNVDLLKQLRPPAPHVLVLDRDDLPGGADAWAARLVELGADINVHCAPGYVEMMLDPDKAVVPPAIVSAVTAWLAARTGAEGAMPRTMETGDARVAPGVIERPIQCEGGPFGILSAPVPGTARTGRAILMLNAGLVHHVGPNRLWTVLARRWAALGHLVLRLDLTGIGDAPARPGEPDNVVYGPRSLEDVAAGLAALQAQPGVTECQALGLCSGAYYAFKAAVTGLPVEGVVVINPLTFFWKDGDTLDIPAFKLAEDVQRYQRNFFRAGTWKKVLRGEVNLVGVARRVGRHAASLVAGRVRDLSRRAGYPWRDDLGAELEIIAARHVGLRFVFASGDPGLSLLRTQGGSSVAALQARGQLEISMIDGPNHTFTPAWSHAELTRVLSAALDGVSHA